MNNVRMSGSYEDDIDCLISIFQYFVRFERTCICFCVSEHKIPYKKLQSCLKVPRNGKKTCVA